jgi:hypothetical protein
VLENLRNLIFDKRLDLNGEHQWSDLLPLAQRIINASFNSSIGCSPAQLVFGDNLELDRCLLTAMPAEHARSVWASGANQAPDLPRTKKGH